MSQIYWYKIWFWKLFLGSQLVIFSVCKDQNNLLRRKKIKEKVFWFFSLQLRKACTITATAYFCNKFSEQMTQKKRNSMKTCAKSSKKETPPIYGVRCGLDRKSKDIPFKVVMNQVKCYKCNNLLPWKLISFFTNWSQQQQQSSSSCPSYPTIGDVFRQHLPAVRIQCSHFVEIA